MSPSGAQTWLSPSVAQAPRVRKGVPSTEAGAQAPCVRWGLPST